MTNLNSFSEYILHFYDSLEQTVQHSQNEKNAFAKVLIYVQLTFIFFHFLLRHSTKKKKREEESLFFSSLLSVVLYMCTNEANHLRISIYILITRIAIRQFFLCCWLSELVIWLHKMDDAASQKQTKKYDVTENTSISLVCTCFFVYIITKNSVNSCENLENILCHFGYF